MTRKHWLAASAVIVLIAVALAALFWGKSDSSVSESPDGQTAQEGALTPEMQTPVYVPPTETLEETKDAKVDAVKTQTAVLLPSKYQFQSAEDALNYYAKMVGDEAERMKNDPSITPPEPHYKEDGTMMYDDKHVSWEDSWYGGVATSTVFHKIFLNDENPELEKALIPFLNDWEPHDWSPPHLMVRAGKWPAAALRDDVMLPNGQIIDLNSMLDKRVVIKYRIKSELSGEGRRFLLKFEKREEEIQTLLASGSVSATESAALQNELTDIQTEIAEALEPYEHVRTYAKFNGDDEFALEEVVFDLGVIDEDLSAK